MDALRRVTVHFFGITVFVLTVLFIATSFYKFVVLHDYTVSYEGDCNPEESSCYIYCETDQCDEPFYYTIIERDASRLYNLCGSDVTTCDEAYTCTADESCAIFFCEPDKDGTDACDTINIQGVYEDASELQSIKMVSLTSNSYTNEF